MQHGVEALGHHVGECRQVKHVNDAELGAGGHRPAVARGQVVGHGDSVAGVEEVAGDDAADVAGAADDERLHGVAARRRASATMATIALRTSSPVAHGSGNPNRTGVRPVGPWATISNPYRSTADMVAVIVSG